MTTAWIICKVLAGIIIWFLALAFHAWIRSNLRR